MIHREATIKYKGYDPGDLKPNSNKRICCVCDICGRIRYMGKAWYGDLCRECAGRKNGLNNFGKNNGMYGKSGICGENHPFWKGGKITKVCPICNNEFLVFPSYDNQIFCTQKCYGIWISENQKGKNNPNWNNGSSYEPYCVKFNEKFKESIRNKYDRKCFLCNKTEQEQMNEQKLKDKMQCRLAVHHVNYDKTCLCNDIICEFVPLCIKCHNKTNTNHEYWEDLILTKLGV